jgi:hypothetical protein
MELQGTIKKIGDTQTFGSNGFQKREIVVETDGQYPQPILIEFVQDKCTLLDKFAEGQNVTIGINIRGREWVNPQGETKYFNSIQGWKINVVGENQPTQTNPPVEPVNDDGSDEDDLPY